MAKTHPPYAPEYRRQRVELVRSGRNRRFILPILPLPEAPGPLRNPRALQAFPSLQVAPTAAVPVSTNAAGATRMGAPPITGCN